MVHLRRVRFKRWVLQELIFAVVLGGPFISTAADKLRVSNCFIGGAILPLWVAKDAGLYQREGLDVELIWIQGNPSVAALISGDIDLLLRIPHNVISGMAAGADLVFLFSVYNPMEHRIVAAPGIERSA